MKVLDQVEIGQLIVSLFEGNTEIVYARETENGMVYCTLKPKKTSGLPKNERTPTI